jgi:hypothetical protein
MIDTVNNAMPDGNFGVYPGYVEYVHIFIPSYIFSLSIYRLSINSCNVLPIFSSPLIPKSEWPTRYWGANYPKLLKIKEKYDPNNVFANPQSVGNHLVSREGAMSAMHVTPVA